MGLELGLTDYFFKYDYQRPHQRLQYRTPAAVYFCGDVQPAGVPVVAEALL